MRRQLERTGCENVEYLQRSASPILQLIALDPLLAQCRLHGVRLRTDRRITCKFPRPQIMG